MKNGRFVPALKKRRLFFLLIIFLIEFLDELVGGFHEAAMPLIRDTLQLEYYHIGILISVPMIFSNIVEPFLFLLGDAWNRQKIILGGGVIFALALLLTAVSHHFVILLIAHFLYCPASGAFVSLSQASLMDLQPDRREQNMARWTFAGALGMILGPLLLLLLTQILGWPWQAGYLLFAGSSVVLLLLNYRLSSKDAGQVPTRQAVWDKMKTGLKEAVAALKNKRIIRWLVLQQASDLMLDILFAFLALYFVDVAGVTVVQAGVAVAVWSGVGLLGDFLLIPLLEKVRGLLYLRVSVILELVLYTLFLLVPWYPVKLVILGLVGIFNAGWYSILQAQVYNELPDKSSIVLILSNIAGLAGLLLPVLLGIIAQIWGLGSMMWVLLLGPVALLIGCPVKKNPAS